MKYKIRYTIMTLVFCGLLGWDMVYQYQKPEPPAVHHPVVRSIRHLIAPAYVPPAPGPASDATSTATSTVSMATSTTPNAEISSSTPVLNPAQATSTFLNRSRKNLRLH